jgi:hypothetical protein
MRRLCAISATFLVLSGLFLGCNRQAKKNEEGNKEPVVDPIVKVVPPKEKSPEESPKGKNVQLPDLKKEKWDAAVHDGLLAVGAYNLPGALAHFEIARGIDDNEFVKSQIADVKARMARDAVAKTTAKDIETVLNDGKAEDAATLAGDALKEFGGGDDADKLVALRLQAEAVRAAEKDEKADARYTRFRAEGKQALEEKNLRAAALAFEQALLARDDADLKLTYDDVRGKLDQYDALRKKAKELRGDPLRQDDALAALKEAKAAWDTLQIRQEIDDCTLALQKRRGAVSVADFELRNDVGLANAGATLADELLPLLQPKYDPVERGQLKGVLADLNLPGIPNDAKQQKKIGKLANIKYLVVGNVHRLIGVSVKARLIDLETGLVVQTGKVVAPTIEEAVDQMKDLARQLMQADEANLKADADKGQQPEVVPANAVLPAAPMGPDAKAPPPPPEMINAPAPGFGNAKADMFAKFAPAPDGVVLPPPDPLAVAQRNRLLYAAVEMGDFLFRAGRFAEAQQQFQFALMLAPDNFDVRARLLQVAPLVPPIDPLAPVMVSPRLVVLPFMTVGNPAVVPPSLSWWTPTNLGPYFAWGGYDVVDPSIMYWYMGRMGLTMNDIMVDPVARRWLARAVGVRYFVFGSCVQTTSFDVNTYLVDTELGYMQGYANINVQNWWELKLRLPELAQVTMMSPADRMVYMAQQQQVEFFRLMNLGQWHMDRIEYRKAVDDFTRALLIYPDNVQAQFNFWLANAQASNQDAALARQQQWQALQAALVAARQRQALMAQASQQARQNAIAQAAARSPAQQTAHQRTRFDARANLLAQAQTALQTNRPGASLSLFQAATTLTPATPAGTTLPAVNYQALAQARLQADNAQTLRVAQFTAARETALRKTRDKELADTRAHLDADRARAQKQLETVRFAQGLRDLAVYSAGIKKGQELMAQKKYDAALASFQSAQRVAPTAKQQGDVNAYINVVVQSRADQADPSLGKKLAADNEQRKILEAAAKDKDAKYKTALQAAQVALSAKNLDAAQAKYLEAGKLFDTDAVRTGLKQVNSARAEQTAAQQKADADKMKAATLAQLLTDGKTALNAQKYGAAVKSFSAAKKLAPDNLDAIAGLAQAEQASANQATVKDDPDRLKKAKVQELITTGQAALKAKNYDAAEKALRSAKEIDPSNPAIVQGLRDVDSGRKAIADTQKATAFQAALDAGDKAMTVKKYDVAVKSYTDATKLDPTSARARTLLQQAQIALGDVQTQANYQKAMTAGATAMFAKKYDDAVTAYKSALKYIPNDQKATQQLAQAQQLLQESAKVKAPPADPAKAFSDAMQRGAAAEKKDNYADAVKAFSEALKLRPKDADANAGWKKNQFSLNMQQGQQYLDNMMWVNAQGEFEAALRIFPKDANALKLLQKAKNKGK